jgi:hypothetical protein
MDTVKTLIEGFSYIEFYPQALWPPKLLTIFRELHLFFIAMRCQSVNFSKNSV